MSGLRRRAAVAGGLLALACGGSSASASPTGSSRLAPAPPGDRVLFVGNSLTAENDLALLVEAMAGAGGVPLSCTSRTFGGAALEDHWTLGTPDVIRRGGWRYVVLQQGPSSLLSSRENLRAWSARFAKVIRSVGAVPALYLVWPERVRIDAFAAVRESYRLAAEDVRGLLLPAGEAWLAAWREQAALPLYGPDDFHPSRLGTYAAAATIYGGLTGRSPEGLPARLRLRNGVSYQVDAAQAALVQSAAAEALAAWPSAR